MKKWVPYTYKCRFVRSYAGIYCELPKIPIELLLNRKIFPTEGVIDSGCTRTHIRADIADFFGIETSALPEATTAGITGSEQGRLAKISLHVLGHGEPFDADVVIVKDLPVPVLLGNNNFFDTFDVRFERSKQYFYIRCANP